MSNSNNFTALKTVSKKTHLWWLYLPLLPIFPLLALIAFSSGCFPGAYIFDDKPTIRDNQALNSPWLAITKQSAPEPSAFNGRPIAALSFAVANLILPSEPGYMRLFSIILHSISGWLIFCLIADLSSRLSWKSPKLVALFISTIWMVHPIHCQAVLYLSQRTSLLMGLCFITCLWASIRRKPNGPLEQTPHPYWTTLGVLACWIGVASKEVMVVAPLAVILIDVALAGRSHIKEIFKKNILYYGLLLSSWIYLAIMLIIRPVSKTATFGGNLSPVNFLKTQGEIIFSYLHTLIWPEKLIFDYGDFKPVQGYTFLFPLIILALSLSTASYYLLRKKSSINLRFFATTIIFTLITLAPNSSILPNLSEIGAERRMLLPSLGIIAAILAISYLTLQRLRHGTIVFSAIGACLIIALTSLAYSQSLNYKTEVSLWRAANNSKPANNRASIHLALALHDTGKTPESMTIINQVITKDDLNQFDQLSIAEYFGKSKQWKDAYKYQKVGLSNLVKIYVDPTYTELNGTIRLIELVTKYHQDYAITYKYTSNALKRFPNQASIVKLHAIAASRCDKKSESIELLKRFTKKHPEQLQLIKLLEQIKALP